MDDARTQVLRAWLRAVPAPGKAAKDAFEDVAARYGEAHRAYHDLAHVRAVLETLELLDAPCENALALAAILHDVVYEPASPTNEEESAAYAGETLGRLGVDERAVEETMRLIRATERHEAAEDDVLGNLLHDADLAILGADAVAYTEYTHKVRLEYQHVPEPAWREGRSRVLKTLLTRERVYTTDRARELYETRARENMQRELEDLEYPET